MTTPLVERPNEHPEGEPHSALAQSLGTGSAPITAGDPGSGQPETPQTQHRVRRPYPIRQVLIAAFGLLLVAMGFLSGYTGALGTPRPYDLQIAYNGPGSVADQLDRMEGVTLTRVDNEGAARRAVSDRVVDAAIVVTSPPAANKGTAGKGQAQQVAKVNAIVSSGSGRSVATTVIRMAEEIAARSNTTPHTEELAPLASANPNGTWEFYTVIFVGIGASLGAAVLGRILGPIDSPADMATRVGTLTVFTGVLSLLATWYADGLKHALPDHGGSLFLSLWAFSTAVALALAGIESALGFGAALLAGILLVILGNASAGGPVARPLLNGFYDALNPILPQGATVNLVREVQYHSSDHLSSSLMALGIWGGMGILLMALAAWGLRTNRNHAGAALLPAPQNAGGQV